MFPRMERTRVKWSLARIRPRDWLRNETEMNQWYWLYSRLPLLLLASNHFGTLAWQKSANLAINLSPRFADSFLEQFQRSPAISAYYRIYFSDISLIYSLREKARSRSKYRWIEKTNENKQRRYQSCIHVIRSSVFPIAAKFVWFSKDVTRFSKPGKNMIKQLASFPSYTWHLVKES